MNAELRSGRSIFPPDKKLNRKGSYNKLKAGNRTNLISTRFPRDEK